MRKFLLAVVAIAVMGLGFGANAQIPYVQVSFDDWGAQYAADCPPTEGPDTVSVWACNFNMWMNAIEHQIDYSSHWRSLAICWIIPRFYTLGTR